MNVYRKNIFSPQKLNISSIMQDPVVMSYKDLMLELMSITMMM